MSDIYNLLKKKYPSQVYNDAPPIDRLRTGIITLDYALGGGLPMGRVTQLVGHASASKTSTSLMIALAAIEHGIPVYYLDLECALDDTLIAKYIPLQLRQETKLFTYIRPGNGEEVFDILETLTKVLKDQPYDNKLGKNRTDCLIIIDSVPHIDTADSQDSEKSAMTRVLAVSKILSREKSKFVAARAVGFSIILINQLRANLSPYGGPTEAGGTAIQYVLDVNVQVARKEVMKDQSGISVENTTKKNKTAPPYRKGKVDLYFGPTGFDKAQSLIEFLSEHYFVKKGNWYSIPESDYLTLGMSNEKLGNGLAASTKKVLEIPGLYESLTEKAYSIINSLSETYIELPELSLEEELQNDLEQSV